MIGRKHDAFRPSPSPTCSTCRTGEPWGGLVILHGAGSRKENHADMAAAAAAAGLAVVRFDMRGHGETGGLLDGRAIDDVAAAAALLPAGLPFALRGSSMGGYLALSRPARRCGGRRRDLPGAGAAARARAAHRPRWRSRPTRRRSRRCSPRTRSRPRSPRSSCPVLIQHAEGDEQVPVAGSRALAARLRHPASRLEVTPGGDHRSVQHDPAAQQAALEWLRAVMA